jgi:hypothetical protein
LHGIRDNINDSHINGGNVKMAKRKAEFDAVDKYSKTPKKNVAETEFSAEFSEGENRMKGANRNSKQGRVGKS